MKRLLSTLACAAVLSGFAASAHASIPVKMAPAGQSNSVVSTVARWYIIILVYYVDDLPEASQDLANVDQAAEFDHTT
jgi:hypothetical protein